MPSFYGVAIQGQAELSCVAKSLVFFGVQHSCAKCTIEKNRGAVMGWHSTQAGMVHIDSIASTGMH